MTPKLSSQVKVVAVAALTMLMTSCGEYVRQGRSPSQVVIQSLSAASGATPDQFGGALSSDVLTLRTTPAPCTTTDPCATIFGDSGQVQMALVLKDPGQPGLPSTPSALNAVTFTRYRVTYRRSDGRNQPGVDVPFPFDSALTFTVPVEGSVTAGFSLVRVVAKTEAPLAALVIGSNFISTIAEVSFFGRDLAGNDVSATGSIGVSFGNFGDPQ